MFHLFRVNIDEKFEGKIKLQDAVNNDPKFKERYTEFIEKHEKWKVDVYSYTAVQDNFLAYDLLPVAFHRYLDKSAKIERQNPDIPREIFRKKEEMNLKAVKNRFLDREKTRSEE